MRAIVRAAGALALALTCFAAPSFAAYPERPVTLIVPWGAGGGTDATARIIGSLLEKELGQPVNVVNRTGGSGVVGRSEEHTSELQSLAYLVCRLLLEKKKNQQKPIHSPSM